MPPRKSAKKKKNSAAAASSAACANASPPKKVMTPKKNSYIEQMERNKAANMAVLRELGLLDEERPPVRFQQQQQRLTTKTNSVKKRPSSSAPKKRKLSDVSNRDESRRKSARIEGKPAVSYAHLDNVIDGEDRKRRRSDDFEPRKSSGRIDTSLYKYPAPTGARPQVFGAIPGVPMGELFISRQEANWAGVHRPLVAGISGTITEGVYSICMSGGYEDDVDYGHMFTYTGAGGRDLKGTRNNPKNLRTAPQSKDQTLDGMNLALSLNVDTKNPVRVMRGYKLDNEFAPPYGFRYDGLYSVEKCWRDVGLSGFLVYKYAFKRVEGQEPPPWEVEQEEEPEEEEDEN